MGAQGNRNLTPETGKHTDAGIEQSFLNNKMSVNFTYFNWDIKNKIRWVPDDFYFYRPQNLDTYSGQGYEVGINYFVLESVALNINYTYSDAEEELLGGVKRKARYTAEDYMKFGVNYVNEKGFGVSAVLRYTGDRVGQYNLDTDVNPAIVLGSYYTIDININQRLYENWLLSINCSNLFDEEYDTYTENFTDSLGTSTPEYYPGAGRSVFFNVTYEF
jgi:outer membrane receptor protein involved in Fe transport